MGKEQKRDTWESLKEEGNKLFAHRKYEQGNYLNKTMIFGDNSLR